MGRELKRVAMDFDWPVGTVWDGYLNQHYRECPHCEAGYSKSHDVIAKHINSLMWCREVSSDENVAKITEFLAGRSGRDSIIGHDSIDAWSAIKKLGSLAGLPDDWTKCSECKGEGIAKESQKAYDEWEPTEPPKGDGYQLWENTTEGSPNSPVFGTLGKLCDWCSVNATTFGAHKTTSEEWARMLGDELVCHKSGNIVFL